MPVTVTRIYDSEEKAKQAAADLKQHTSPGQVMIVAPSDSGICRGRTGQDRNVGRQRQSLCRGRQARP